MSQLSQDQLEELQRAFDLTQDSGVVDLYGAKKMLQIFNMNPTSDDVARRYQEHNKDAARGLTFEEFKEVFKDYLLKRDRVPGNLTRTLNDLFEGPVTKTDQHLAGLHHKSRQALGFAVYQCMQDIHQNSQILRNAFSKKMKKNSELRKILTEMGSEPFESEEADEVINEIAFDENGQVPQEVLMKFLLNKVNISTTSENKEGQEMSRDSPMLAEREQLSDDEF